MTTAGQYGGLRYQSPTTRALGTITDEQYQKVYNDQAELTSKMVNDLSFVAANLRKVQQQADKADENVIQQLQDFINDIQVIMGGQGDTGFDFGDFKYVLEAYGALFDFIGPDGNIQVPVNLNAATENFFNQYLFGGQNWQQAFDSSTDSFIATMLDILGEVPILNQAAQQLAVIISKNRDDIDTIANVFNIFFQAFNIPPGGTFDLATFMNATNTLYMGLAGLFSDVNFGSFQPIFEQMARWDQEVVDAIYKLSIGDWSGLNLILPITQLTNLQPNLQPESDFADSDSIASGTSGISWDGTVGRTALGSAKFICDGTTKGMNGHSIAIDETQTLSPSVWVKWTGVTSSGNVVQLLIRADNGVDYLVAQTNLGTSSGGWAQLSGTWTNPSGSGILHGRTRLVVTSGATAGNVWFDDAPNTVGGTLIPQDWINDLVDQWDTFLASIGFASNGDYIGADPATIWTNWYNEIMADLNLVAPITAQDWLNRFIEDETILWDVFNSTYQRGLPTDTPTTLGTNGKRTTWAAANDLAVLLGLSQGTTTPPTAAASAAVRDRVVTGETNHQTLIDAVTQGSTGTTIVDATSGQASDAVAGLRSTLTDLQSTVANKLADDAQVIGGNVIIDDGGGTTSPNTGWGSNWTLVSNTGANLVKGFNCTAGTVDGYYNVEPLNTVNQIVGIIFNTIPAQNWAGGTSGSNRIWARRSADFHNGIWCDIFYDHIQLGYRLSNVDHTLGSPITGTPSSAGNYELHVGDGIAGHEYNFMVTLNGNTNSPLITYVDSANVTSALLAYFDVGQSMTFTSYAPGNTKFHARDVIEQVIQATMACHRNTSTTSSSLAGGGIYKLPLGWFGVQQYMTPGITLDTVKAGYKVSTEGRYEFSFAIELISGISGTPYIIAPGIWINGAPTEEGQALFSANGLVNGFSVAMCKTVYLFANDIIYPILDTRANQWTVLGEVTGTLSWMQLVKL